MVLKRQPHAQKKVPRHIAIIMDGNGRWARRRGMPRTFGHRKGAERVKEVIQEAMSAGVKALTLFAFSTENWARPRKETSMLFSFMCTFLKKNKDLLVREHIRFHAIGRRDRLYKPFLAAIEEAERLTMHNNAFILNIALDYGGRWDIVRAVRKAALDVRAHRIKPDAITEETFGSYLELADIPDPDFLIRTSGEVRISNFLLWQCAYSELYFTDLFWPEFTAKAFRKALEDFRKRKRRFGKSG